MKTSPSKYVLVLRTCNADLTSYAGFQWPASGPVEAPTEYWGKPEDRPVHLRLGWDPDRECSGGLHGLLWGEGDGDLLNFSRDAKWLVVRVLAELIRTSSGKVRFPGGTVVHAGTQQSATEYLLANGAEGKAVVGASVTAGYYGTATAGYRGTATAGDRGTATAGDRGTATAGDRGTATAGYRGTATAGYYGTATAGDRGTATAGYFGTATAGYYGTATAGYRGTATAGYYGTATAGDRGTATAGDRGTATAGDRGILQIRFWDRAKCRFRVSTADVGEAGIQPNTKYCLNSAGLFVPAE